jgi:hypothetical protein
VRLVREIEGLVCNLIGEAKEFGSAREGGSCEGDERTRRDLRG